VVLWDKLSGPRLNPRESEDREQRLIAWQVLAELRQLCTKVDTSQCMFSRRDSAANPWAPQGTLQGVLPFCEDMSRRDKKKRQK